MTLQYFNLTIQNQVAHLAINRPDKANALNHEAWSEYRAALLHCDQNPNVRAIVLSGEGDKLFCAGIDLSMLMNTNTLTQDKCEGRKREKFRNFLLDFQDILTTAEKISKPVLSAIHGACIGGGVDLVAATEGRRSRRSCLSLSCPRLPLPEQRCSILTANQPPASRGDRSRIFRQSGSRLDPCRRPVQTAADRAD